MRIFFILALFIALSGDVWSQSLESLMLLKKDTVGRDTSKVETASSVPAGNDELSAPRNYYNLLRNKSVTRKGLFTVHMVKDNYYFEIPDSLLGRDILIVSRIAQGAAGVRPGFTGYAGDQIGSRIIRFEKGPGHKLFLRRITFDDNAGDSTHAMYNAVVRSNLQPLVASFGIGAYSPVGRGRVIEVTDYINGDNDILFFSSGSRNNMHVGSLQRNMSYIKDVKAYPLNVEIRTVKTYSSNNSDKTFTLELNTSIVLLPKTPMKKRLADPRVGYFSERYTDYNSNPQGVKEVSYIKRWRLEPKPEDVIRYTSGELVEPAKPIVYYIDPATPKKWIPYLKQGVEDWQVAFEKAGFKNAIVAQEAPGTEAAGWSLEDSRHSAIVYKPSSHANAAGPVVTDPRSGEILESHINWYHNLMSILRDWYFVQCAPNDKRAQKMTFDDELMGQLIRSVAAHEVGHTLGLTHNYGASSTIPVEKLRDKEWVEANGLTPSIMDYARFNYVAQPEDSVGERGLISRIGAYDMWAIEWGYRWYPQLKTPEEEKPILNKWIVEKMADRALWYGSEFSSDDPRTQTEDLGDNAMKAGEYGVRNLRRVMDGLLEWTAQPNEGYVNLAQLYQAVTSQYEYYIGHVLTNIGGIYETPKTSEQTGAVYHIVPAARQREAMTFLDRNVFNTPKWLLDTAVLSRIGESPTQIIIQVQTSVLNHLLNPSTLSRLAVSEAMYVESSYPMVQYFSDIDRSMWTELSSGAPIDIYRRNLQRAYVDKIIDLAGKPGRDYRDVGPILQVKLKEIEGQISKALQKSKDPMTVYHLRFIRDKIHEVKTK